MLSVTEEGARLDRGSQKRNHAAVDEVGNSGSTLPPSSAAKDVKPEGYQSAYNIFARAVRPVMLEHHPSLAALGTNGINSFVGSAWKKLPPDDKLVFDELSRTDKER